MREFGQLKNGQKINNHVLENEEIRIEVSEFGGSLISLWVKDKNGDFVDIVLGFQDVSGYESDAQGTYIGCNVGRVANRISGASFSLHGEQYKLDANEGNNTLHSGFQPYSKRIWTVEEETTDHISLSLISPDKDQGFPGEMQLKVTYQIAGSSLRIQFDAKSDKDTPISITNHSYFNLNGQGSGTILNHVVSVDADTFVPIDVESIPTGEILNVKGTPMDFTNEKRIGQEIEAEYEQLQLARGYDHNWCLNGYDGTVRKAVIATGDKSGITMTLSTDYPGIQMYTGNYLDQVEGKQGNVYNIREAVCFEPQFYPDAVNRYSTDCESRRVLSQGNCL